MRLGRLRLVLSVAFVLTIACAPQAHADPEMAEEGQQLAPGPDADGSTGTAPADDGWTNKYGSAPDANSWTNKYATAPEAGSWKDKYRVDPDSPVGSDGQPVSGGGGAPTAHAWPRRLGIKGYTGYLYAPQLESWDQTQNQLQARAAVSVQSADAATPTYGVVWLTAHTQVDEASGQVALTDVQVTKVSFPSASDGADYLALMRAMIPGGAQTVSLARLQTELTTTHELARTRKTAVRNDPPRIIFSPARAMLIPVNGEPVLRPMQGTSLSRVINTRALILRDQAGTYYLYIIDRWLQAPAIEGPWSAVQTPTDEMEAAKTAAVASKQVDLADQAGSQARMEVDFGSFPTIYVSTTRAALIQTQGDPRLEPVEGTRLQFVTNTFDNIFLDTATQDYYVLISGRWFRSPSLANGPWSYVAANALPPDFAKIPADHVAGDVLSSVAGTPQAETALVDNSMPRTATVNRQQATLTVVYDGEPRFQPIEGTALRYAVNAWTPVIASGDSYYAVDNGVWFQSGSPSGPWVVATSVPDEIYAIPPSTPLYYVTYASIYGSTDDEVFVGYTPGYFGAIASADGVVVYGTGWDYAPWIGSYWIGAPLTYGLGAALGWNPVDGFGWGFASDAWGIPWWGPVGWGWAGALNGRMWNVADYDLYGRRWANAVRAGDWAGEADARLAGWRSALYAGADGRVYRRGERGWEYNAGADWRRGYGGAGLERDAMSRLSFSRVGGFAGGYRGFAGGYRGGGFRR